MVGMCEAKREYFDKENTGVWDVPKFAENVKNDLKFAEKVYDYYISWKCLLAECEDVAKRFQDIGICGHCPDVYKISEDIYILSEIIAGKEYFIPYIVGEETSAVLCEGFDEALLRALAIKYTKNGFNFEVSASDAAEILGMEEG